MDEVFYLADNPYEIKLALWFHDAVYKPLSSKNEHKSANWAVKFFKQNNVDEALIKRVYSFIMATLDHTSTDSKDKALMIDIDLSILGQSPEIYHQFEKAIRKEYKWVPTFLYRKKRKEALNRFFIKKRIYHHPYFYEKLEKQARENLKNTMSS